MSLSQLNCIEPWKDLLLYKGADEWAISLERGETWIPAGSWSNTLKGDIQWLIVKNCLHLQLVAFVNRDKFITADPKYLLELMLLNMQHFLVVLFYHCLSHHGWTFMFFLSRFIVLCIVLCWYVVHRSSFEQLNWRYIIVVFTGTWISTTDSDGDSTKSATKYWKKKLHTSGPFHRTHRGHYPWKHRHW